MLQLLTLGDYFGTFVFAVTGGIAAAEKRLDLSGFLLLGFVTGVGGGTMRDLIISRGLVFWAHEPVYITLCIAGALVAYFGAGRLPRLHATLIWSDAVGLAVFAVIGAGITLQQEALPEDAKFFVAVFMGVLTATGGGILREILRNELPIVLQRELYMSAAFAGAAATAGLYLRDAPVWLCIVAGFALAFGVRACGIHFDLSLPRHPGRRPAA